jgi:hypothetical protein
LVFRAGRVSMIEQSLSVEVLQSIAPSNDAGRSAPGAQR